MGRISTFDQAIADEICDRLLMGEPLAQICRDDAMPGYRTVYDWKDAHPNFAATIARARDLGEDVIAANTRRVARGEEGHSSGDVQRDKLIVDTDLKLLAKWNPKRYGDRLQAELTGAGGGPITLNIVPVATPEKKD